MANQPFFWGDNGQKITSPEQAARKRAIAEALIAQSATPGQNWAQGLSDVAAALSGTVLENRVSEAEAAGRERAGGLFADLAVNQDPNAIIAALTNPDAAWASPAQTSIASALLNSGLERADPMYQMNMEKAQLELEALRNPTVDPWANTKVINDQVVGWGPEGPQPMADFRSPDSPLVQVNTGDTNDFFSGLSAAEGENFAGFLTAGQGAARNMFQIDRLEGLLAQTPGGLEGGANLIAGNMGIDLGSASGVQAAQALINTLVPAQRPPGSGPMSDADLELYKQSLPRIINQPGGNELIVETLRGINQYDLELARITQEGLARAEMTDDPKERAMIKREMRTQINALANPVDKIRSFLGSGSTPSPSGITIRKISD